MPVTITGSNTPTAGGVTYGDGATYANTAAGTSGQVLQSNGASAPTWATIAPQAYPASGIANSTGTAWGTSYSTTGSGTVVALATSPTFVTPILGTPTSGTLTNATGLPLTTGVTGTLPIANGGTGQTALSAVAVGTSTNLAGGSNGTIPYQSAAGTTQMLAVGTAGQVLQTNGAGAPTWVTPGGGNWILLQTNAFTSAATVDFSNMSSTYDLYFLEGVITSTGGVYPNPMAYRFINSTGTVITSSYYNGNQWGGEENTTNIRWSSGNSYGSLAYSYFTANYDINLNMYIMRSPNNETNGVYGTILSLYSTPIAPSQFTGGWGSNSSGTLNVGGIRIFDARVGPSDLTGTLRLWGWKKT